MNFLGLANLFDKKKKDISELMLMHNSLMRSEGLSETFDNIEEMADEYAANAIQSKGDAMKRVRALMEDNSVITKRTSKETVYWCGVRPPDGVDVGKFITACKTWMDLHFQGQVFMTLEQKGLDVEHLGDGAHMHALIIPKLKNIAVIRRESLSHFKKCGVTFFYNTTTTKGTEDNIMTYMTEYRSKDEHKVVSESMDVLWRNSWNIPGMYTKNEGN